MSIENRLTALQSKVEELLEITKNNSTKADSAAEEKVLPPLPMQVEIRTLELWRSVVAECLGSLCYVFFVCGVSIPWTGHFPPFLSIAFASAMAYGALTWKVFPGAHLNPAFTLALTAIQRVSTLRCLLFITAQSGGAIAGAAILFGLTVPGYQGTLGATTIASHIEPVQAFGLELILTFVLTLTFVSDPKNCLPTTAMLLAASLVALPCTGAGLNPVRSLGPAFVMNKWPKHWVFWLGPIIGGVLAAYFHQYVLNRSGGIRKKKERRHMPTDGDSMDIPATEIPVTTPDRLLCERFEPLYGGTRSLYLKPSPVLPRTNLNRSQSVYASKRYEFPPKFLDSASTSKKQTTPLQNDSNYESLYERKPGLLMSGPPSYDSSHYKIYEGKHSHSHSHSSSGHGHGHHHARERSDAIARERERERDIHTNGILAQYETAKGLVDVDPKAAMHNSKTNYYETSEVHRKHADVPEKKLIDTCLSSATSDSSGSTINGNPPPPPRFRIPMQPPSSQDAQHRYPPSGQCSAELTNDLSRGNHGKHNGLVETQQQPHPGFRKPYDPSETKKLLEYSPGNNGKTLISPQQQQQQPHHHQQQQINHYSPRLLMAEKDSTYSRILEPILNSKPAPHQPPHHHKQHHQPHPQQHQQQQGLCAHMSPNDRLTYSYH